MISSATIGTRVRFRESFGEVGADRVEFTIDGPPTWANPDNGPRRLFVQLRYVNRVPGCGKTRLGWVDDLVDA